METPFFVMAESGPFFPSWAVGGVDPCIQEIVTSVPGHAMVIGGGVRNTKLKIYGFMSLHSLLPGVINSLLYPLFGCEYILVYDMSPTPSRIMHLKAYGFEVKSVGHHFVALLRNTTIPEEAVINILPDEQATGYNCIMWDGCQWPLLAERLWNGASDGKDLREIMSQWFEKSSVEPSGALDELRAYKTCIQNCGTDYMDLLVHSPEPIQLQRPRVSKNSHIIYTCGSLKEYSDNGWLYHDYDELELPATWRIADL